MFAAGRRGFLLREARELLAELAEALKNASPADRTAAVRQIFESERQRETPPWQEAALLPPDLAASRTTAFDAEGASVPHTGLCDCNAPTLMSVNDVTLRAAMRGKRSPC